eukprot:scaffold648429_cov42-Prasinocladus_malaysianus.AAC.1
MHVVVDNRCCSAGPCQDAVGSVVHAHPAELPPRRQLRGQGKARKMLPWDERGPVHCGGRHSAHLEDNHGQQ